ncbi:MAG: GtrA family protein [Bacteroidales bacterium]|nr:GtrA family protein [Bacteroidales bacterium]
MRKLIQKYITAEFIRFVLVAMLNTLFGYGVYTLLVYCGMHFSLATLISTILGVLFNFKTYGILVFKNSSNKLIFRFVLVYCVVYLCNIGGIALLKTLGMSSYLAGAVMLVPVGLLGFILNKIFVYSQK